MIAPTPLTRELRGRFVGRRAALDGNVRSTVEKILTDFRRSPDATLRKLTAKYDRVTLENPEVTPEEFNAGEKAVSGPVKAAIKSMFDSVTRYQRQDIPKGFEMEPFRGVKLGKIVHPYGRAGLYVPGGRAVYPSSVVMAAAPAAAAGVGEMILCTPPTAEGGVPGSVLHAARICGVKRVFKVGGAQAVFAMAYGTEVVPACDIIVGPGNAYVTAAKDRVRDDVAIDFLAGPTELLVVSDGSSSARFIAAELVGQAEHAPDSCCVLVTTSADQAGEVVVEIERQATACSRKEIILEALTKHGALITVANLEEALDFANDFAPEHLSIATRHPAEALKRIRNAGSVFLGEYSPVAMGDYGAGPNAILPTYAEARRRPGLSATTFLKTVTYQMLSREGLEKMASTAITLAREEGLDGHLRSVEVRLGS